MDARGKEVAMAKVDSMRPERSTNLMAGITLGFQQMHSLHTPRGCKLPGRIIILEAVTSCGMWRCVRGLERSATAPCYGSSIGSRLVRSGDSDSLRARGTSWRFLPRPFLLHSFHSSISSAAIPSASIPSAAIPSAASGIVFGARVRVACRTCRPQPDHLLHEYALNLIITTDGLPSAQWHPARGRNGYLPLVRTLTKQAFDRLAP